MSIDEKIDLTLESDFASQYNDSLKPQRVRSREYSNLFSEGLLPEFEGLIMHLESEHKPIFFNDILHENKKIFDYIDSCKNILGECKALTALLLKADPWAVYMSGDEGNCDRCGIELDLLNRCYYSLCDNCISFNEKPMEVI